MTRSRLVRAFWLGAAALLVAAALVALAALLRGELSDTDGRILATLGAMFLAGAAGLAGLGLADAGRAPRLGFTAALVAPAQLAILAVWIWSGFEGQTMEKLGGSVLLVLGGELVLELNLLILSTPRLRWLVRTTTTLVSAAVGLTIAAVWAEPESDALAKWLAALWILAGLSWFLLPVLQRYTAAAVPAGDRVVARLGDVELVATRSREGVEVRLARGERLLLRRRG